MMDYNLLANQLMIWVRRFSRECWTDSTNNIGLNCSYIFFSPIFGDHDDYSNYIIIDIKYQLMMGHGLSKVVKTPTNGCADFCLHFFKFKVRWSGLFQQYQRTQASKFGNKSGWDVHSHFRQPLIKDLMKCIGSIHSIHIIAGSLSMGAKSHPFYGSSHMWCHTLQQRVTLGGLKPKRAEGLVVIRGK